MKKYSIILLSVIILIGIMFLPGCLSGNSNSGSYQKQIKIFEVQGGIGYVPNNLNLNGLVFADSLSEIGNEYVIYSDDYNTGSAVPMIQAFYYDESGNKVDVPVSFIKDLSTDDCFNFDNLTNLSGGGTSFNLTGNSPGGKGKIIASCNGLTREVDVYVYDSYGVLGYMSGRKIDTNGVQSNSTTKSECAFFSEVGGVKIVGKSYFVDSCDDFTWKEKLKAIKTINVDLITGGNINNLIDGNNPQIYVAEVPGAIPNTIIGYVKIVRVGPSEIWEYTPNAAQGFK
jgi:hypothetical protein